MRDNQVLFSTLKCSIHFLQTSSKSSILTVVKSIDMPLSLNKERQGSFKLISLGYHSRSKLCGIKPVQDKREIIVLINKRKRPREPRSHPRVRVAIATWLAVVELAYLKRGWIHLRDLCLQQRLQDKTMSRSDCLQAEQSLPAPTQFQQSKSKCSLWSRIVEILEPPSRHGTAKSPSPQMKAVRCFPIHAYPHT